MLRELRTSVSGGATQDLPDLECCALKCCRSAIGFCKIKAAMILEPSRKVTGNFVVLRIITRREDKASDDAPL